MSIILPSPVKQLGAYAKLVHRRATSLPLLKQEMTSRELPDLHDDCSKIRSDLLDATLFDILPRSLFIPQYRTKIMPQSYHLAYFHPPTPLSSLFPDGTDPLHSPGLPFIRRLWAGGDITFNNDLHYKESAYLRCKESIKDVEIKGNEGEEKIFVTIERRINYLAKHIYGTARETPDPIIENRKLVFMRDLPHQAHRPPRPAARNISKHLHPPLATHKLTPSPTLLFRFSALTFNAHKIHLSKTYCQQVEHHRNLLVHGPLTLILMLQFLTDYLTRAEGNNKDRIITSVTYRNIAPLYAEEEMTLCVRQKGEHLWETWIQGPEGGLAVRASVRTAEEIGF
ncbi:MAG: hypothetical protein Q9186_007523 [Xanthomendoza sp. 1 TL-2023]